MEEQRNEAIFETVGLGGVIHCLTKLLFMEFMQINVVIC